MFSRILITLFFLLLSFMLKAQQRYLDLIFNRVDSDTTILYHLATYTGEDTVNLYFDFYEPQDDTAQKRPLIIWLHGGFGTGNRKEEKVIYFSQRLSLSGYANASIDYRGKVFNDDSTGVPQMEAIYRGIQDTKQAIRFFRQNADLYKIDTSKIVVAGMSSGSLIGLHAAYMQQEEVPEGVVDTSVLGLLDEDTSISSSFKVLVNCWGTISDTNWIKAGDIPVMSICGVQDPVMPFETNGYMQGPMAIARTASRLGIENGLQAFGDAGHGLHVDDPDIQYNYYDISLVSLTQFLSAQLFDQNEEFNEEKNNRFKCYPNPTNGYTDIRAFDAFAYHLNITLYDAHSNELLNEDAGTIYAQHYKKKLDLTDFPNGIYFLRIVEEKENQIYSNLVKIIKK
jgi:pimeloyl-ACP methyl ester carboxylesterase